MFHSVCTNCTCKCVSVCELHRTKSPVQPGVGTKSTGKPEVDGVEDTPHTHTHKNTLSMSAL